MVQYLCEADITCSSVTPGDKADENPPRRVIVECQQAVSCSFTLFYGVSLSLLLTPQIESFALLELSQTSLQLLSEPYFIVLHLTFAQNSYYGCEY